MTGPGRGVDVGYEAVALRGGADAARAAATGTAPMIDRLAAAAITADIFGQVDPAEPLAAGLMATRDGVRELAERIRQRHQDLAYRGRSAAAQGDQLVVDTSRIAGGARPIR